MNFMPRLSKVGQGLLLLMIFWAAAISVAVGQAKPKFVAGEIILYCKPGTPQADVNALAAQVQAEKTVPLRLADCYKLVLPPVKRVVKDTLDAVAALKADPRVKHVGPNRLFYSTQATGGEVPVTEPNDPRYKSGEMWGLKMINMPQAWVLQKGALDVNAAVIDTGGDPTHEDLAGQYIVPGSYDFGDNDTDFTPNGTTADWQHGVHVGGTIAARANNSIGVASICGWGDTKILMLKASPNTAPAFPESSLVNSLNYAAANKDKYHIATINMSLGGPGDPNDTTDPFYVATKQAVDAGIIVVAAAGNDNSNNSQDTPCGFSFSTIANTSSSVSGSK